MEFVRILHFLAGFAVTASIYAIFSLGLNVHWGYTGLFNIGIAGFFAIGAYTSALVTALSKMSAAVCPVSPLIAIPRSRRKLCERSWPVA